MLNFREVMLIYKIIICIFFFNIESRDIDKLYVIYKLLKDNGKNGF